MITYQWSINHFLSTLFLMIFVCSHMYMTLCTQNCFIHSYIYKVVFSTSWLRHVSATSLSRILTSWHVSLATIRCVSHILISFHFSRIVDGPWRTKNFINFWVTIIVLTKEGQRLPVVYIRRLRYSRLFRQTVAFFVSLRSD